MDRLLPSPTHPIHKPRPPTPPNHRSAPRLPKGPASSPPSSRRGLPPSPVRSRTQALRAGLLCPSPLFLKGAAPGARCGGRLSGTAARRVRLARTALGFWSPRAAAGSQESQSAFLFNYLHLPLGADILGSGGSVTSTRGAPRLPPQLPFPRTPPFSRLLGLPPPSHPPFSLFPVSFPAL